MQNVEKIINGVTISIDYKVELIGLLITLSDENKKYSSLFYFNRNNDYYINELKRKFGYLVDNATVKKFFYLKDKYGMHYEKTIELALSLDDNFEFKEESNYKFKDNVEIIEFCRELKILNEQINFKEFYNNHRNKYLDWIKEISPTYENHNIKELIVNYCGTQYDSYKFYTNLIPFETSGGYGVLLRGEAHNCLRARKSTSDNKLFYIESDLIYLPISIHEYLHSIINPLTSKYNIFNYETEYLYDKNNPLLGYENDYCMINETIIRAMTTRMLYLLTGVDDLEKRFSTDELKGFKYVRVVYNKLLEYEIKRNLYVDIDSFYKEIAYEIIRRLDEVNELGEH